MSEGAERIAAERQRQIEEEKWSAEHDDCHRTDGLAWAAVCYAAPDGVYRMATRTDGVSFRDPWPWAGAWDKRSKLGRIYNRGRATRDVLSARRARIRDLVKAGALIAAEIDRLTRMSPRCSSEAEAGRCSKLKGHEGEHDALVGPFGPAGDLWGAA